MMVGGREVSGFVMTSEMLVAEAREVDGQGSVEEGRDPAQVCMPGDRRECRCPRARGAGTSVSQPFPACCRWCWLRCT